MSDAGDALDPFDLVDTGGSLSPSNLLGLNAPEDAAKAAAAGEQAKIDFQREQLAELSPVRQLGFQALRQQAALSGLDVGEAEFLGQTFGAITPEMAQQQFQLSPGQKFLQEQAERSLLRNAAATGQLGGGLTQQELQRQAIGLGQQFQQQNISNLGALAGQGRQEALGLGQQIGQGIGNIGNIQAQGILGAGQARSSAFGALLGAGSQIGGAMLSDRRFKEGIKQVGTLDNGLPVYTYRYKGSDTIHMGVMAQEIEKLIPNSVIEDNGIKFVNYGVI
jgi:hypothetical protein